MKGFLHWKHSWRSVIIVLIKAWDIIARNESVAKIREEIKPIAKKLITSQIGTSINQEIMNRHLVRDISR